MNASDVSRYLPLAFLAPDIIEAILDGSQPSDLTVHKIKRLAECINSRSLLHQK